MADYSSSASSPGPRNRSASRPSIPNYGSHHGPGPVRSGSPGLKHKRVAELIPAATDDRRLRPGAGRDGQDREHAPQRGPRASPAKLGVTSDLTLDGTYNPDFSQVEADAGQIDFNQRYSLYYEEKRPFFLEGSDLWQFGAMVEEAPAPGRGLHPDDRQPGLRLPADRQDRASATPSPRSTPTTICPTTRSTNIPISPSSATSTRSRTTRSSAASFTDREAAGIVQPARRSRRPLPAEPDPGRLLPSVRLVHQGPGRGGGRDRPRPRAGLRTSPTGSGSSTSATRTSPRTSRSTRASSTGRGCAASRLSSCTASTRSPSSSRRSSPSTGATSSTTRSTTCGRAFNLVTFRFRLPRNTMVRFDGLLAQEVYLGQQFNNSGFGFQGESQLAKSVYLQARARRTNKTYYDPDRPLPGLRVEPVRRPALPAARAARPPAKLELCRISTGRSTGRRSTTISSCAAATPSSSTSTSSSAASSNTTIFYKRMTARRSRLVHLHPGHGRPRRLRLGPGEARMGRGPARLCPEQPATTRWPAASSSRSATSTGSKDEETPDRNPFGPPGACVDLRRVA